MRTTIREVARRANVGIGTVSRVINGDTKVSEQTRKRVVDAIAELGYVPDQAARALRSRRTGTVAAVVPFFSRNFYIEVLRGIERACRSHGFSLIVLNVEHPDEVSRYLTPALVNGQADGLLIVSIVPDEAQAAALAASPLAAVLIDASYASLQSVVVDHAEGARLAVNHLLEMGHRRIALIDRPEDPFSHGIISGRELGYSLALEKAGIEPQHELMMVGDYSKASGRELMEDLLSLPEPPTAVFAGSDLQAIGAMEVLKSKGLRVGEDLCVVGYNDIELAEYVGLTTVRLPTDLMGEMAMDLLKEEMSAKGTHGAAPKHVSLDVSLVVRESCGARGRTGNEP